MTTKVVEKQIVKKKKLKANVVMSKSLYFLLLSLGFCVIAWFVSQAYPLVSQGYDSLTNEQSIKHEKRSEADISGNN